MRRVPLAIAAGIVVALAITSHADTPTTGGGVSNVKHDTSLTGSGTTSSNLGIRKDCTDGQVLAWNGTAWACAAGVGTAISGTLNTVPKFTGANAIGNSRITDDGTSVAISSTATGALQPWLTMVGTQADYRNSQIYLEQQGGNSYGPGFAGSMIDIVKKPSSAAGGEGITLQFNANTSGMPIEISSSSSGAGIRVSQGGSGLGVDVESDSTGAAMRITKGTSAGKAIDVYQNTADYAIATYAGAVGSKGAIFVDGTPNNTAAQQVLISASQNGSAGAGLRIDRDPGVATGGQAVRIFMGAQTTGSPILLRNDGSGNSVEIDHRGAGWIISAANQGTGTNLFLVSSNGSLTSAGTGSFGGALNMNSHLINNVTDPVSAQDAVTLHYLTTSGIGAVASNVIPKGTGTGLTASSLTDDGTTISTSELVALGGAPVTSGKALSIRGNQTQLVLETTTASTPGILRVENSGDTLWDLSPIGPLSTDATGIRVGRRSTGGVRFDLLAGNNSSTIVTRLTSLTGETSYTANPLLVGSTAGAVVSGNVLDAVDYGNTGQTASKVLISARQVTSSFNTTAGALSETGVKAVADASRSAGANNLTNYAVYADARNGQVNYSFYSPAGTMEQTGGANFRGNVGIDGSVSLGDAAGDAISVFGTATFTPLVTATGGITTPANLTTTGAGDLVSADDLTVGDDATITDALAVNGNTTLGNATSDTTTINGLTTINVASGSRGLQSDNNNTGQTVGEAVLWAKQSGSFDTTGSSLTNYGVKGVSTATRSAGANDLVNVGVYGQASGGQDNRAGWFDGALVVTTGGSTNALVVEPVTNTTVIYGRLRDGGTPPAVSSCGTSPGTPTGGNFAWRVIAGTGTATSCTFTHATSLTTVPSCQVTVEDSTIEGYIASNTASAITITGRGTNNLAGLAINVNCIGDF